MGHVGNGSELCEFPEDGVGMIRLSPLGFKGGQPSDFQYTLEVRFGMPPCAFRKNPDMLLNARCLSWTVRNFNLQDGEGICDLFGSL